MSGGAHRTPRSSKALERVAARCLVHRRRRRWRVGRHRGHGALLRRCLWRVLFHLLEAREDVVFVTETLFTLGASAAGFSTAGAAMAWRKSASDMILRSAVHCCTALWYDISLATRSAGSLALSPSWDRVLDSLDRGVTRCYRLALVEMIYARRYWRLLRSFS